jgi:hypothetical protein
MRYRVKFLIWQIDATSAAEAKHKVLDLVRTSAENLFHVEEASTFDGKRSLLRMLIRGK